MKWQVVALSGQTIPLVGPDGARAAVLAGDPVLAARATAELGPAEGQQAGAASGLLTFGPVAAYLAEAREAAGG
ncbi:hypothetical protein CLM83_17800 [Streptomyces albidoflavus]|uniref:hypothetical protein n=1 Tax=Streptomyces albidoflavus TaxID=1886 RepID=UPI000BDD4430|nr:hypothetical protein [Streptomyces albidoflavus]PBO17496.1 hypothetical protein CLM83_17800 [Streptomyces albidoflavus]